MTIALPHLRVRRSWWPTILLCTAACLPAIVSMQVLLRSGYWPVGDDALTGLSVHDVLTGHFPVMGPRTTTDSHSHVTSHHLGPALAYLWALPAHLLGEGPRGLVGAATLTSCLVCIAIVLVARAIGGMQLAVLAVVATMVVVWALGLQILLRPFNPFPGVLMTVLLGLLVWGLALGRRGLFPLTAAVASVMAQSHLSYAVFLGVPVIIGTGVWIARQVLARRLATRPTLRRRDVLWTILVVGLIWLPPVIELFRFHPNNAQRLWAYLTNSRGGSLGLAAGMRDVLQTLAFPLGVARGRPAWWSTGAILPEVIGGVLLVGAIVVAVWRSAPGSEGRQVKQVRIGARVAVLLLSGAIATVAVTPPMETYENWNHLQLWPSAAFTWMVCARALGIAWSRRRESRPSPPAVGVRALATCCLVGALALAFRSPVALAPPDIGQGIPDSARLVQQSLVAHRSPWGDPIAVTLTGDSFGALLDAGPALAYALTLRHDDVYLQRWTFLAPEDLDYRLTKSAPADAASVLVHEIKPGSVVPIRYRQEGTRAGLLHDGDRSMTVWVIPQSKWDDVLEQ